MSIAAQGATPFGLRIGMSRAEVEKLRGYKGPQAGQSLAFVTPPQPHPDFESYGVVISPTQGLCKVIAIGRDITLNSFGDQLKTAFAETSRALEEKYGKPQVFDYVQSGSIWKEREDWAMSLAKEERTLAAMWEKPGSDLGGVLLESIASNSHTGYLRLSYESPTFSACKDEVTKAQRSVF